MTRLYEITSLHKTYGKLSVLSDLDLVVDRGGSVAVIGESGAGKSSLLSVIGLLDDSVFESFYFSGYDVKRMNEKDKTRLRLEKMGFLFQHSNLLPDFTALENVTIPSLVAGNSRAESLKKAKELLSGFGLSGREEHFPSQLSGGEAQRVALARSLMNDPDVLLADEPTGNLDAGNAKNLLDYLEGVRQKRDLTLILATHSMRVSKMAETVYELKEGKLLSVT
jgi:ABC-type lipoprotein export system ATPase subunit